MAISKFIRFLKTTAGCRFLFGLALTIFVLSRVVVLDIPFFWDELGVYGQAVFYMVDNGPGILPGDLPPELSRGHPLAYVFVNSIVASVLGENRMVLHGFNLLISCLVIFVVFRYISRHWGPETGLTAAVLMMVQPLFYTQSTMVLPEMSLTLLVFLMWIYWLEHRPLLYILCGLLAVWTKETAIVFPLALFVADLFQAILTKQYSRRFTWTLIPWLGFAGFLLIQKAQNGWFFFPYHASLIDLNPASIWIKLREFTEFLWLQQYRFLWTAIIALMLLFRISAGKGDIRSDLNYHHKLISICWLIMGMILFSALNPYMNRYLLVLLPFAATLTAFAITKLPIPLWTKAFGGLVLILLPISYGIGSPKFEYDEDRRFRQQVEVTTLVLNELTLCCNNEIVEANFPAYYAIRDSRYGYFDEAANFIPAGSGQEASIVVIMTPGDNRHNPNLDSLQIEKEFWVGSSRGRIYRRPSSRSRKK